MVRYKFLFCHHFMQLPCSFRERLFCFSGEGDMAGSWWGGWLQAAKEKVTVVDISILCYGYFYPVLWVFLSCVVDISVLCYRYFCPVLWTYLSCVMDVSILCYGHFCPMLWTFLSCVMDISVLCCGHFYPLTLLSPTHQS